MGGGKGTTQHCASPVAGVRSFIGNGVSSLTSSVTDFVKDKAPMLSAETLGAVAAAAGDATRPKALFIEDPALIMCPHFALRENSFDDFDSLESGHAREYVPAELLNPPAAGARGGPGVDTKKRWIHCRVTRRNKTHFEMRDEASGAFMLSAVLDKKRGCFYISSYEHDAPDGGAAASSGGDAAGSSMRSSCVALLARNAAPVADSGGAAKGAAAGPFHLRLCGEAALAADAGSAGAASSSDGGGPPPGVAAALGVSNLGPPIASARHSVTHLKEAGADMRELAVSMPEIRSDGAHYLHGPAARRPSWGNSADGSGGAAGGAGAGGSGGGGSASPPGYDGRRLSLRNRLPEWNPQWGCLYLKFNRGRVKESSSKNFLVYDSAVLDGAPHVNGGKPAGPDDAVLQFGKVASGTFVLDFRAPVGALQAFGISLSAFAFKI